MHHNRLWPDNCRRLHHITVSGVVLEGVYYYHDDNGTKIIVEERITPSSKLMVHARNPDPPSSSQLNGNAE